MNLTDLPIKPMLAELAAPPTLGADGQWSYPKLAYDPNMAFEFKWDGHRLLAYHTMRGSITLYARSGRNVTSEYAEIAHAVASLGLPPGTVLDGEAVALVNGKSNLQALAGRGRQMQSWRNANIRFMAFDVLFIDGKDVMRTPFSGRKALLETLIPAESEGVQVSKHVDDIGIMWPLVVQYELEGVIAKPLDAPYKPDERGTWSKLKLLSRSNFHVVGYTQGSGSRADTIGALVLAEEIPLTSELRFSGKCGTGFSGTQAAQLLAAMQPLETVGSILTLSQAALARASSPGNTITWLQKGLVVEVEYAERSDDEIVRFPSFKDVVSYAVPKTGAPARSTRPAPRASLPPAPPPPTGMSVGFAAKGGAIRKPQAGDVFQAPGSTGLRSVVVKGGDKGLYLACECPAGKFVWKGGSFSPCKHMKHVLAGDLAGNTIVDGIFA